MTVPLPKLRMSKPCLLLASEESLKCAVLAGVIHGSGELHIIWE